MPLGILSDDEFLAELGGASLPKDKAEVKDIERGRGEGTNNTPDDLRKIISEDAINGIPAKEIEEAFGLSRSSISAYKNGATSTATYHTPNVELAKHVNSVKEKISRRASKRLNIAFDNITPEKLEKASLKDVLATAQIMSGIVKNMETEEKVNTGPQVQFVFMAPRVLSESDFGVVQVNE